MLDALFDALIDTGKLLPILFLTYLLMEYLEHHAGSRINRALERSRGAGPLLGSLLGLVPQCGFSGAAASLYASGTITVGTLLAVFLATSDEMLPILVSAQVPVRIMLLILGVKLLSGLLVGFPVDAIQRRRHRENHSDIHAFCQQEHCSCEGGIFRSALRHTGKIILLIFIVTLLLNVAFLYLPQEKITAFWGIPVIGELAAGLLGLFPNCSASVLLTDLYVKGVMGPGPMLSGLLVNAGVGLLVLFRVNQKRRENFAIAGLLLVSGIAMGCLWGLVLGRVL